ncbi:MULTISPECIES: hypothetical protein [Paraburkholderia]|uniref:Secreted protein n=1 Tax=Paraburkholderia podalyriae TaxID=1938811 RepID=A0ABR7Q209_9BURK|nr:hypothetical protein [Paraburkholderia podalyriae]MBC8752513.1 hypothetical protein [Paraburkholderia podalyriae]
MTTILGVIVGATLLAAVDYGAAVGLRTRRRETLDAQRSPFREVYLGGGRSSHPEREQSASGTKVRGHSKLQHSSVEHLNYAAVTAWGANSFFCLAPPAPLSYPPNN